MLKINIHAPASPTFNVQVNCSLPSHGVTAVCGPSGSGKTTFLRAIAGLIPKITGEIFIDHQCWLSTLQKKHIPIENRSIGYIFQTPRLFPHLNVLKNLTYGFLRSKNKNSAYAPEEVIDWLQLSDLLNRIPEQLSGGQKRRVALGRALLSYPKLLLLDEPLTGLDLENTEIILQLLKNILKKSNIAALYVTHTPLELFEIADRMLYLENGALTHLSDINEALLNKNLPYLSRTESYSVLFGKSFSLNNDSEMCAIETEIGFFHMPIRALEENIRILIPANAVTLSKKAPEDAHNLFLLPISDIITHTSKYLEKTTSVILGEKNGEVLARLPHNLVKSLDLRIGDRVFAHIPPILI